MTAHTNRLFDRLAGFALVATLSLLACHVGPDDYVPVGYETAEKPLDQRLIPKTLEEMRAIESVATAIAPEVTAATVGIVFRGRQMNSQGSGVIVSEDGLVLTAAHVIPRSDVRADILLPDGRRVRGVSLGVNDRDDSGMIQIEDPGPFDFVEVATEKPPIGQWCIATGHPGGYEKGRQPVFRLGRVLGEWDDFLQTDCPIFSGDSGGPLFDLEGRVIGIHSRIRENLDFNLHVPATDFQRDWNRLAQIEPERQYPDHPILGIDVYGLEVVDVMEGHSADLAGFEVGDVITEYDGEIVGSTDQLLALIKDTEVGSRPKVLVRRDERVLTLRPRLRRVKEEQR